MKTELLNYHLPPAQIADRPSPVRRHCRLLRLDRSDGTVSHHRFDDLPRLLNPHDLLVVNDTAVIPARLLGRRRPGGGQAEIFLLEDLGGRRWRVLVRPGARLRPGTTVEFAPVDGRGFEAQIESAAENGTRTVQFVGSGRFDHWLARTGRMPLPPYIKRPVHPSDRRDYQTVFAHEPGAVAAPTAGLHFDQVLLRRLRSRQIGVAALTLHVGAGTFRPITADQVEDHRLDSERYRITGAAQFRIWKRRHSGRGRVIAVGTTVARTLETVAQTGLWDNSQGDAKSSHRLPLPRFTTLAGRTELFIRPGHLFGAADALITNFHLPRSSLLVLVAAFAGVNGADGLEMIQSTYQLAIREGYRFYSYGDAMLIV